MGHRGKSAISNELPTAAGGRSVLYSLFEAQHAWLTPYRYLAEVQRGWFANPFMP